MFCTICGKEIDENGNVVGSTSDNINNIRPNATWKFKAPIFENNFASFQVQNVLAF